MILSPKSLEKLRLLINEQTEYRSGPQLVRFFNTLGFNDVYGQGFPSRWMYTDEKLLKINGTPELDRCIKAVLDPANFISHIQDLDNHIVEFNKFLTFDKWKLTRDGAELVFTKLQKIEIEPPSAPIAPQGEDEFLRREFANVSVARLGLEGVVSEILEQRLKEIERCFAARAYLSVILLAGSTLEGIFLGLAIKHPKHFNISRASPKDVAGKVKQFHEWTLSAFIDVGRDLQLIQHDTQKFSHSLRDFRNYIHPFEQLSSGFSPREHTAKICLQVLRAAIYEIGENAKKIST